MYVSEMINVVKSGSITHIFFDWHFVKHKLLDVERKYLYSHDK